MRPRRPRRLMAAGAVLGTVLLSSVTAVVVPAGPPDVAELRVAASVTLDPAKTYGRLVITASNVTVDGKGARVVGAGGGEPKSFRGIGVEAIGVSNVVLKNLTVRGFETGLWVENARGWTVEDCDFSGNFDDPSFGW